MKKMSKSLRKSLEPILQRDSLLRSFFESKEFNDALTIIKSQERIDEDYLAYNIKKIEGLSYELFNRVCNSVFYVLPPVEDPTMRSHYTIDYNGLRFNLLIGQGSSHWTERI